MRDDSLPKGEGVYLIHFSLPYGKRKVQHYLGWALHISDRVKTHRNAGPKAAALLRAATKAGIDWEVVKVWRGEDRTYESKVKKRKRNLSRLCPTCKRDANE